MADLHYNPFAGIDVTVPTQAKEYFERYCQTGGRAVVDNSPFPRMVDLWFMSVCVAARLGLEPAALANSDTSKIIEGSIFSGDSWRIQAIILLAIARTQDIQIVAEPRKMMAIVNGLAVAGLPAVVDMLTDGDADPIWNLSDALDGMIRKQIPVR